MMWQRTVGDHSFKMLAAQGWIIRRLYTLPGPRASTGSFDFATEWQLVEPTIRVTGAGGPGGDATALPTPQQASQEDPYVGRATLEVVDAGRGTAADYAGIDARGKLAVVARDDQVGMWNQVQAAKAAGVALLFVHNTEISMWVDAVYKQGLPTYRIDARSGRWLKEAVAADPGFRVRVDSHADSAYSYELAFVSSSVPRRAQYHVSHRDLAVVESDYRANSDRIMKAEGWLPDLGRIGLGNILALRRNGPVVRTEYVSTGPGLRWQRYAAANVFSPSYYWTWSALEQLRPGRRYGQVWWGPLLHPAAVEGYGRVEQGSPVARFRDAIRVSMPHYSYGGSLQGHIDEGFGDVSELTLSSNGEVLGKSSSSTTQFTVPPDRSTYELRLAVTNGSGNMFDTSVATDTTWAFHSARPRGERAVLPLVQASYGIDADAYNRMPADRSYPLTIRPSYPASTRTVRAGSRSPPRCRSTTVTPGRRLRCGRRERRTSRRSRGRRRASPVFASG